MKTDRINAVIALSGKTKAEIAKEIGITPQNLQNKLKKGHLLPEDSEKIARACGAVYHEFIEFPDGTRI